MKEDIGQALQARLLCLQAHTLACKRLECSLRELLQVLESSLQDNWCNSPKHLHQICQSS